MKVALVFPACVVIFESREDALEYVRDYFGDEDPYTYNTWSIKPIRAP